MNGQAGHHPGILTGWQRRPLLGLLPALALGIVLRSYLPVWPVCFLAAAMVFLIIALLPGGTHCLAVSRDAQRSALAGEHAPLRVAANRQKEALAFLLIATLLIGLSAGQIELYRYPDRHIALFSGDEDRLAEIEFRLAETPRILTSPEAKRELPPKQTAQADVTAVKTTAGWLPAQGRITVFLEEIHPRLLAGQRMRAAGILQRSLPPDNPGQFDFADYNRQQRILVDFKIHHAEGIRIVAEADLSLLNWGREKVRHLLALGYASCRSADCTLLTAMLLGDRDEQTRDVQEQFLHTGLLHLLTISGLHIALVGWMFLMLARLLRLPPRAALLAATAIVVIYCLLALPTWPGVRSLAMWLAASVGVLRRQTQDRFQLLAVATTAVVLIHPADAFSGGFQISFAAILGLLLLLPRWLRQWQLLLRQPLWANPDVRPQRISWISRLRAYMLGMLLASIVAWLVVMPLVAYHFGQFSLWSAPASAALMPLTALALFAAMAKVILTLLLPGAAALWANACLLPMLILRHLVAGVDRLPGASAMVSAPSVGIIILYYAALFVPLLPLKRPLLKWTFRLAPALACLVLLLLPATGQSAESIAAPRNDSLTVTLLSIGAGQTAVVHPPGQGVDMVDTGSSDVADVARSVAIPYFHAEGITRIDRILLSHGDFDHISAAADLFLAYDQPPICLSPHFVRHAVGNLPAEALLQTLEDAGKNPTIIKTGDRIDLGGGASIDVLWPPADCTMNSNNCGEVLKLHFAGKSVLFTADIQDPPELALLKHPEQLKADVLIAPHHGSSENITPLFLQAVSPKLILASSAYRLTHKQKQFDKMAAHWPFYRTGDYGAIELSIDHDGKLSLHTFRPSPEFKMDTKN